MGEMKWTPLRVLKAKASGFGRVALELESDYIKNAGTLPGMEEYASQEDPSDHEAAAEEDPAENAEDLALAGMIVPISVPDPDFAGAETDGLQADLEASMVLWEGADNDTSDEEISVAVSFDDWGNLVCSSEDVVEVKEGKGASHSTSPAFLELQSKDLATIPCLQGCGLCWNRTGLSKSVYTHLLL